MGDEEQEYYKVFMRDTKAFAFFSISPLAVEKVVMRTRDGRVFRATATLVNNRETRKISFALRVGEVIGEEFRILEEEVVTKPGELAAGAVRFIGKLTEYSSQNEERQE